MLHKIRFGEILLLSTGVLLLANVLIISQTGDFTVWIGTKVIYFVGVVLFIFDR